MGPERPDLPRVGARLLGGGGGDDLSHTHSRGLLWSLCLLLLSSHGISCTLPPCRQKPLGTDDTSGFGLCWRRLLLRKALCFCPPVPRQEVLTASLTARGCAGAVACVAGAVLLFIEEFLTSDRLHVIEGCCLPSDSTCVPVEPSPQRGW